MIIKAVTFEIEVYLDLNDFAKKDIRANVQIEDGFEFIAQQTPAMAAWLRKVADDIEAR